MNANLPRSASYVRDVAYRSKFVPLQAPALLSYDAALAGFVPPDPGDPFRYLEFGCGSGVTLNALAAACPHGEFIGVDFNGRNVAAARSAAATAGLGNVTYVESAFAAFDAAAIPQVDYVACMGTYSWLDDAEKAALIGLFGTCLREGGLLCLNFITLGRAAVTPMWRVLRSLVPERGQGSLPRLKEGIGLLAAMRDQGAHYLKQNAPAMSLFNEVYEQYQADDAVALENLSHNLLADGYRYQLLDEIVGELQGAGLRFCAAAAPHLNDPDLAVPEALRSRYDALPDSVAQAIFLDFLDATRVRTDVFVRAAKPDPAEALQYLERRARASLGGGAAAVWQQLEQSTEFAFRFSTPVIRHVFDRIAAGESGMREIADHAPFGRDEVYDAFHKLVAASAMLLCVDLPPLPGSLPTRVRPASGYNQIALDAALGGLPSIHLAATAMGSCLSLGLPASLLVAELCANGLGMTVEVMHQRLRARVERMDGVNENARRQFADPRFFAQVHRNINDVALPLFLRLGVLAAG